MNMKTKIILFGDQSLARRAYTYLTYDSPYEVVGFTVDAAYLKEERLFGLPVVPFETVEAVYPPDEFGMFLAIGYSQVNKLRAEKFRQARARGYTLVNYISSKATTWPDLSIGDNCFVSTGSVIEPMAVVGDDVFVGINAVISHEAVIGEHCTITHHAVILGEAVVSPYCFIGANATIRNGVTVARACVIGAGAVILEDTVERGVYKGNPAVLLPIPSDKLPRI